MGFKGIQAVAGLTDEQAHEGALWLADQARDVGDGWELLEACGLVPYESAKPPKIRAEHSAPIKHPVRGQ